MPPRSRPAQRIKPKPKPKPKPKAKPKPAPRPPAAAPAAGAADHSTLDIGAMAEGQQGGDVTQVTTEGGPGQESAVFSTGPSSAEMLHYRQTTTYQQVYADQISQGAQ